MYNKLNMKVNNLQNEPPDVTPFIRWNQYKTGKQSFQKKNVFDEWKKYPALVI